MGWQVSWTKGKSKTKQKKDFGTNQDAALTYARELEALGEKFVSNVTVQNKSLKDHWYYKK